MNFYPRKILIIYICGELIRTSYCTVLHRKKPDPITFTLMYYNPAIEKFDLNDIRYKFKD